MSKEEKESFRSVFEIRCSKIVHCAVKNTDVWDRVFDVFTPGLCPTINIVDILGKIAQRLGGDSIEICRDVERAPNGSVVKVLLNDFCRFGCSLSA